MLQRRTSASGVGFYISPLLEAAGVRHAFSTRQGGISPSPFDSLNLGNPSGCARQDDDERIQHNYQRLQAAIACAQSQRCWVHQVHGGDVVIAEKPDFENGVKADGLVTTVADHVLAIRVADCVPVLLTDQRGRTVAAIHAGWRGVMAGVIPAAIERMKELASGLMADGLLAAVGPCIGREAFEVGEEVVAEFERAFGARGPFERRDGWKGRIDLSLACRIQLRDAGIPEDRIDHTDRCTYRDADEFFSHRRENGVTGRMAALIAPSK